ncbi:MAG: hypothetical protein JW395_4167 [Nitrospira sp.]|nr:hypothetical protein [Nitrospira sp.]
MDYRDVERQLDAFRQSLGLELAAARTHLAEVREYDSRPFSYRTENGNNQVEQIAEAFGRVWAPALVKIFSELRPYEALISLRKSQATLTAEFVNWFYLFHRKNSEALNREAHSGRAQREYTQMMNHLMVRAEAPVSEQSLRAKLDEIQTEKSESLAFNVVFQRAMIEAFWHFQKLDSSPADEDPNSADELFEEEEGETDEQAESGEALDVEVRSAQVTTQAERFVRVLNQVIDAEPGWLEHTFSLGTGAVRRSLWLGALLSVEQRIDFAQGASVRSAELILWAPLLAVDIQEDGIAKASGFETFWDRLTGSDRDFTPVQKALQRSIRRYTKSTAVRILRVDDSIDALTDDQYEERLQQEVKPRLKFAWKVVSEGD